MVTQKTLLQPHPSDRTANDSNLNLKKLIAEKTAQLISDPDIQGLLASITANTDKIALFLEGLIELGRISSILQEKCRAAFDGESFDELEDSRDTTLYKSLLQTYFPGTAAANVERLLSSGFNANAWSLTSLSYAAAETVQAKLDLLELGQQIGGPNEFRTGHYRVSQRLIGGNEKHPIYIKVLVLSDQQIFSFDWIKIKKCFERLLAQELIKAALPFEQFKKRMLLSRYY